MNPLPSSYLVAPYDTESPPFTVMTWPVMCEARGLARKTASGATFMGPGKPSCCSARCLIRSKILRVNSSDIARSYDLVSATSEGVITLTRIL